MIVCANQDMKEMAKTCVQVGAPSSKISNIHLKKNISRMLIGYDHVNSSVTVLSSEGFNSKLIELQKSRESTKKQNGRQVRGN